MLTSPVVHVEQLSQATAASCTECDWTGRTSGDATHHTATTGHETRTRTVAVSVHTRQEAS